MAITESFKGTTPVKHGKRPANHAGAFPTQDMEGVDGTLTLASGQRIWIDPNGASVDLTLTADHEKDGVWFELVNLADAAETITVKKADGTTIVAVAQNQRAFIARNATAFLYYVTTNVSAGVQA